MKKAPKTTGAHDWRKTKNLPPQINPICPDTSFDDKLTSYLWEATTKYPAKVAELFKILCSMASEKN